MMRPCIQALFFHKNGGARGINPEIEMVMGHGISPTVEAIFRRGDTEDQAVCEVALRRLVGQDAHLRLTQHPGQRYTCRVRVRG